MSELSLMIWDNDTQRASVRVLLFLVSDLANGGSVLSDCCWYFDRAAGNSHLHILKHLSEPF